MPAYGPFPRDSEGRIIVGQLFDTSAVEDQPPPAPNPAPAQPAPAPALAAPPAPRHGETPTPFRITPASGTPAPVPTPASWRERAQGSLVYLVVATLAVLAASAVWSSRPAATAPATTATAASEPTSSPEPSPTSRPMLTRSIVAFDAPGGSAVGALDAGRIYTVAEEVAGWRRLDVPGSGTVWARAWEMDGLPPPTATPEPSPTPEPTAVPYVAPPRPVYVPPPPPVVSCRDVVLDGESLGQACGTSAAEIYASAQALMEATGSTLQPTVTP